MKQSKRIAIRILEANPELVDTWMIGGFVSHNRWQEEFTTALKEDQPDLEDDVWHELEKLYKAKAA